MCDVRLLPKLELHTNILADVRQTITSMHAKKHNDAWLAHAWMLGNCGHGYRATHLCASVLDKVPGHNAQAHKRTHAQALGHSSLPG